MDLVTKEEKLERLKLFVAGQCYVWRGLTIDQIKPDELDRKRRAFVDHYFDMYGKEPSRALFMELVSAHVKPKH